ncbi:hypothetical protein [Streptomyces spectabilis]|uniref:Uncharacterized protein n=1 Tax=Streptomyces spectabilis TaxID=68270 RepID=A0A516R118_STRST|nr:hypothetical protein [Streptomyces spectabilis]QDQ09342.1 hypothetical protein FH965_01150 [Streptomyces spectabilis]
MPHAEMSESSAALEHTLEQALRSREFRDAAGRVKNVPNAVHLRTRARRARLAILAKADEEYSRYVRVRAAADRYRSRRRCAGAGCRAGGGAAVLSTLVPVLSAVIAEVLLLTGLALAAFTERQYLPEAFMTVGLIAATVAVGSALPDLARPPGRATRRPAAPEAAARPAPDRTIEQARAAWHMALLERGVMPFLLGCLTEIRPEDTG